MKKNKLFFALITIFLSACNQTGDSSNSESGFQGNSDSIADSSETSSIVEEESSSEDLYTETKMLNVKDIVINKGEVIEITNIIDLDEYQLEIADSSIAALEEIYIGGVKEGTTTLTIYKEDKKQTVNVTVVPQEEYVEPYKFSEVELSGKKIVAFGDSVTAIATIGQQNANNTYSAKFASHYDMEFVHNYAIGGTTATYTYYGSNIYKEYANNKSVLDGCQVVYKAYKAGELADIDYAFIAYGHNDQYFQPPISVLNDREYCVDNRFTTCKSYKGSYRYMINVLRLANPDIKIILLNCTYSEYDKAHGNPYGKVYSYERYRRATKEIAIEMDCKHIDPWDYLKDYYDYGNGNIYYKDSVHLSVAGHKILADYIIAQ